MIVTLFILVYIFIAFVMWQILERMLDYEDGVRDEEMDPGQIFGSILWPVTLAVVIVWALGKYVFLKPSKKLVEWLFNYIDSLKEKK